MNKIFKVKNYTDVRGGILIPIEFNTIKFSPKRIFSVNDVPKNSIRGEHAHYKTEQLLVCVQGKIIVGLDNGKICEEYELNPGEAIYIDKMIWDYQKFITGNEFMLVLASTNYDPLDYINDKKEFYRIVNGI
jgi:dTDP-4-dehydrorhamnose 3,5-epimerase-like enzyme